MDAHLNLPLARSGDVIVEELSDELLVYDSRTNTGHCLSPDAARVWRHCDGRTPVSGLSAHIGLSNERVASALDELERCELLEPRPAGTTHTRRELGVRVVKVGALAAAAPLIISVSAPTPAMAATAAFCGQFSSGNCGGNTGCSSDVGCCCCTPPLGGGGGFPDTTGPCKGKPGQQCKSCVPTDQQNTLCPQYGHGAGTSCSSTG